MEEIVEHQVRQLVVAARANTSDEAVIKEVLEKYEYEVPNVTPESGERWLDLGANIGTFALYCSELECDVGSFEPEPSNYRMLELNVARNGLQDSVKTYPFAVSNQNGTAALRYSTVDRNLLAPTLQPTKRKRKEVEVGLVDFREVLPHFDCVKMDIEGAEGDLLDIDLDWSHIKKLNLGYHWNYHPQLELFWSRMRRLEKYFETVEVHGNVPKETPDGTFVPFRYRELKVTAWSK